MKRSPIKRKPKRHVNLTPEVIAEVNQRADEAVGYGKCERCGNYPDFRGLAMCEPLKQMGGTTKIFEAKEVQRCCYPCHLIKDHGIKEVKSEPMWSSKL